MTDSPATRASLLVRIRDGQDREAWRQFVQVYAPVVYGFARKRGLQDADAADLMQEVLRSVAVAAGRLDYDAGRGSFRGWLYTVTRNKIFNVLDSRRRRDVASAARGAGGSSRRPQRRRGRPGREYEPPVRLRDGASRRIQDGTCRHSDNGVRRRAGREIAGHERRAVYVARAASSPGSAKSGSSRRADP
jgi:RNA polymerase sigma factor (sigma-70 family)